MWYLFFQIWVWLIVAFILGWIAHWFFCCRGKNEESAIQSPAVSATAGGMSASVPATGLTSNLSAPEEPDVPEEVEVEDSWKPQGFASPPSDVDDLKRIKGVGAVIEETLNGLGIYQLQQIANWNHDNIAWIENFIAFPGRISREDWITQARTLDSGGSTEFANRVDKGDVDY